MAANVFDELDQALDEESWNWLSESLPAIASAVQKAVDHGADPTQIRRRVMGKAQRYELAVRCEMAARWLQRSK